MMGWKPRRLQIIMAFREPVYIELWEVSHDANAAIVVGSTAYTKSAKELAVSAQVHLTDHFGVRSVLEQL